MKFDKDDKILSHLNSSSIDVVQCPEENKLNKVPSLPFVDGFNSMQTADIRSTFKKTEFVTS